MERWNVGWKHVGANSRTNDLKAILHFVTKVAIFLMTNWWTWTMEEYLKVKGQYQYLKCLVS